MSAQSKKVSLNSVERTYDILDQNPNTDTKCVLVPLSTDLFSSPENFVHMSN